MNEINKLQKDKKKAEVKKDWKEYAGICNYLGQLLYKNGDYEASLAEHKLEKKVCESLNDSLGVAVAHRRIGECFAETGRFAKALAHQQQHLKISKKIGDDVEVQRAWATIGRTYFLKSEKRPSVEDGVEGNMDETCLNHAQKAFLRALEMSDRLKAKLSDKEIGEMKGRLLLNIGLVFDQRNRLQESTDFIKQAILLNQKYELTEDLHRCQYSLALILVRNDKLKESLRVVDNALFSASKLKDKAPTCEALLLKSEILTSLGDFLSAKNYLKRAHKVKTPIDDDNAKIEKYLKIVYKLNELEEEVIRCKKDEHEKLMKIYENIADGCVLLGNFNQAIQFYKKMLKEFQETSKPDKERGVIYSSIAHTYLDLKRYDSALEYFKLELECYKGDDENFKEKGRVLLNVAFAAEELGDVTLSKDCHWKAYDVLKGTTETKLKLKCLKYMLPIYESSNDFSKADVTRSQIADLGLIDHEEEEESEDEEKLPQNGVFDDLRLSDISDVSDDSCGEDSADVMGDKRSRRRKKPVIKKVNEVGETALHRASITGNLKVVQHLLQKGHSVNSRDYCGWLPIHEAANHGHLEVVRELLSHGAWVNDRGGEKCEGFTPLHDSASCGNVQVMRLLIENGASVLSLTDSGESPLESLVKWRKRSEKELDAETMDDCKSLENYLLQAMEKMGQKTPSLEHYENSTSPPPLIEDNLENYRIEERPVNGLFEREKLHSNVKEAKTNRNDVEKPATKLYQEAMCQVGKSSAKSALIVRPPSAKEEKKKERAALIDEDLVVGGDDWLVPDQKECAPTRTSSYGPNNLFSTSNTRDGPKNIRGEKKKKRHSTFYEEEEEEVRVTKKTRSEEVQGLNSDQKTTNDEDGKRRDGKKEENAEKDSTSSLGSSSVRVKVKISDKMFLVPIPKNGRKRVRWLADDVSSRYREMTGMRPVVHLSTEDGAILGSEDVLMDIVQYDERLVANIDRWDLPPLTDRYKDTCKTLGNFTYGNVKNLLQKCETTDQLSLSKLSLGSNNITPIFRAIRHHAHLNQLSLDGNKIGDEGLNELARVLPSLPSLARLKLSNNGLTLESVRVLSDLPTSDDSQRPLKFLKELDLSSNPLGDRCSPSLATLISRLPNLDELNLSSCEFTSELFQHPLSNINKSIQESTLTSLSIGGNGLSSGGVELLLRSVNAGCIRCLDLEGVIHDGQHSRHFLYAIGKYFSSAETCVLEQLNVANCCLNDDAISTLYNKMGGAVKLTDLSLAQNEKVSIESVIHLLNAMKKAEVCLAKLNLVGCSSITCRLDDDSLSVKDYKVECFAKMICLSSSLRELRLSADDDLLGGALHKTWIEHWGDKAICTFGPKTLIQFNVQ